MFSVVFVMLACGVEMAKDRAELNAAVATMKRLAVSACVPMHGEKAINAAQREELNAIVKWLEKFLEPATQNEMTWMVSYNLIQVAHTAAEVGTQLSTFPEEELCWLRVYLNLAAVQMRIMKRQPPPTDARTSISIAERRTEQIRKMYRAALARCAASK